MDCSDLIPPWAFLIWSSVDAGAGSGFIICIAIRLWIIHAGAVWCGGNGSCQIEDINIYIASDRQTLSCHHFLSEILRLMAMSIWILYFKWSLGIACRYQPWYLDGSSEALLQRQGECAIVLWGRQFRTLDFDPSDVAPISLICFAGQPRSGHYIVTSHCWKCFSSALAIVYCTLISRETND